MLYLQKILGFLSHLDQSDWLIILTVAILGLTFAVVLYAKYTLRAARASLDFFSNPVVKIEGERNLHGPYRGVPSGRAFEFTEIATEATLTLCNYSPMEIIVPKPVATARVLPDDSSDSARAAKFQVQGVQVSFGRCFPEEPYYVVANTLPLVLPLRGPRVKKGEQSLRLAVEFKIPCYYYRGKTYGPLIAICTFLIEPQ